MSIETKEYDTTKKRIRALLTLSFSDHAFIGTDEDTFDMDSLIYVDLAIALESEFDVDIDNNEIMSLNSVNAVVEVINSKLNHNVQEMDPNPGYMDRGNLK